MILHLAIIFLASAGFSIALYVYRHKYSLVPLTCPITRHHCDDVVHSQYSKLFGIQLEFLGMAYYGLITLVHLVLLVTTWEVSLFINVTLLLSLLAFCFSLYLTAIQAFILRQWCTWCLMSASICTAIVFLTLKLLL